MWIMITPRPSNRRRSFPISMGSDPQSRSKIAPPPMKKDAAQLTLTFN